MELTGVLPSECAAYNSGKYLKLSRKRWVRFDLTAEDSNLVSLPTVGGFRTHRRGVGSDSNG